MKKYLILLLILGTLFTNMNNAEAFTTSSYGDLEICNTDGCNNTQKQNALSLYATRGWIGIGLSKTFDLNLNGANVGSTFQLPVGQIAWSQNGDVYGAWNIVYSGIGDSPPADGQLYPFAAGSNGSVHINSKLAVSNPSGQGTPTLTSSNTNVVQCNQWGCWGIAPGSAYVTVSFSPVTVNIRGRAEEYVGPNRGNGYKEYWWLRGDNTVARTYSLYSVGYMVHVPPYPPANLQSTCSPDGNSVTLSWNNQPGYNRVYFRNYDTNAGQNYAWNDDLWGSSNVIGGLTHGHTYSWWIHTRADSGAYSDASVATFSCSPTTVDQCNNVDGMQTLIPSGMVQNPDGSCSPVVNSLSVSCSAPSVDLGNETVFTASATNSNGPVSYQWLDSNQNNIIGETNSTLREVYSTVNSHTVYIRATDASTTVTNYCNATVNCDSSYTEGELTACDINGNRNRYTCTSTGWQAIAETCGGPGGGPGTDPVVSEFDFSPNIVSVGNNCGLTLTASNVSSCRLVSVNVPAITVQLTGVNSIELIKSRIVPVGRYSLSCTNVEGTITKEFGTKSCVLNPDIREN